MTYFKLGRLIGAACLLLTLTACEYVEVDGVGTRTWDETAPPQNDVASFDGCEPGSLDRWRANGEVVNNTDTVASYEVVVAFLDGNDVRLDEKTEWIRDLGPGQRAAIDRSWWLDDPDAVTGCELLTINRFG